MINREATIRWKGYNPDEIISHPSKRVWANCDICGYGRWVALSDYRDLCHKCAMELRSGENHHFFGKYGDDHPSGGKPSWNKGLTKENNEFVKKMSESNKGRYGSLNSNYNINIDKFINENINKHLCKCGCGKYIIIRRAHYHIGIPEYIRGHAVNGNNNPMWKGGISFDPYCEKFNPAKKREVRDKYNNCDYLTGIHRDICNVMENGKIQELSIHHFDYNKMQGCNDIPWKLVPVSKSHNSMFNKNKPFWEKLILYSLEYDNEYYKNTEFNIFEVL